MDRLLFVYNADSGLANALLDSGRRVFRPKDYPCALCMVTYGPFGMKQDWKKFIDSLPYRVDFLHKDELPPKISKAISEFPCLIKLNDSQTQILISSSQFVEIKDLETLKKRVNQALTTS